MFIDWDSLSLVLAQGPNEIEQIAEEMKKLYERSQRKAIVIFTAQQQPRKHAPEMVPDDGLLIVDYLGKMR